MKSFNFRSILMLVVVMLVAAFTPAFAAGGAAIGAVGYGLMGDVSIYDPRTLIDTVGYMKRPPSFILDKFWPNTKTFSTKNVDVDIFHNKRRMAPFVIPTAQGKLIEKIGYETNIFPPGYVKPKMVTTAGEMLERQYGEGYGDQATPQTRAEIRMAEELMELDVLCTRREIWMGCQALQTGQIDIEMKGDGDAVKSVVVDFQMPASHKIAKTGGGGDEYWTDTVNSDPNADLIAWAKLNLQDSGAQSTIVLMDQDAAAAYMNHPKVLNTLNVRRAETGAFNPQSLDDGVAWLGDLNQSGLFVEVYSYQDWFYDEATLAELPMLDSGRVIVGTTKVQNSRLYGAIQDMEAIEKGMFEVPRYPRSWIDPNNTSIRQLEMQSAPMIPLNYSAAFTSAKVLA